MADRFVEAVIGPRVDGQTFSTSVKLGDPVYWDSGNSVWEQADASDGTKLPRFICVGIHSFGASPRGVLALGAILSDADAPFTAAGVQYLSETAGAYTETAPTAAGTVVVEIGRAITTSRVAAFVNPAVLPGTVTLTILDDILLGIGTGNPARLSWDTTDANANELLLQMPAGGIVDVPVLIIGQSIESVDFGLYNGVVNPRVALFGVGAVTTGTILEFRKARGTAGTPTVITTGDDLGQINAFGYSGADGYVQSTAIEFDSAGTIATTRVGGVIRLRTGTDAAPTVLTTALTLDEAQKATFAGALLGPDGSATVPTYSATNDSDTGLYFPGADLIRFAFGGVNQALWGATELRLFDDIVHSLGTGSDARLSWDTTDGNANEALLQLPAGGATDVPVLVIGQGVESVDLGLYNGVLDPRIAIFGIGARTTGPVWEFRKARGTVASPTVVTSGDDLGTLDFYGAVAAGEYVRAASIRVDMAGTIGTTQGPGTITFMTATDASPSVLTNALVLAANQNATFSGVVLGPAGSATAPTLSASGDPNTGFYFPGADLIRFAFGGVNQALWGATELRLFDDVQLSLGTGPAYWLSYVAASSYFRLATTDSDGGGTDADVIRIPNGQTSVDGNTTFDINVFDDFDDALVLRRAFSAAARTTVENGKIILRNNRQELIKMGVLREYEDGWVGYNDQRMAALLAGGIYQTRQRLDESTEALWAKIEHLEREVAELRRA